MYTDSEPNHPAPSNDEQFFSTLELGRDCTLMNIMLNVVMSCVGVLVVNFC